ncbi:MAG: MFS transporter [Gammaproteobacteria bacterium]|nr:MFS transporter [Gammaproteobacteria bacterium]
MSTEAALEQPLARPRWRVRWNIFLFTFAFGLIAYLEQKGPTIAGYRMMPELGLTQMQLGWLQEAFLFGYTAFQFPSGLIGQYLGARRMFVLGGLIGVVATIATPLAPLALTGMALLAVLLAAQLLLGASQAPIFPVSTGLYEPWFPPVQWSVANGIDSMCLGLGIAITAPLISGLMERFGWQAALLATALPALIIIPWWGWYGRNTPGEHPGVSATERAELGHARPPTQYSFSWARIRALLGNRDLLLLTLSYLCMNYVFYLIGNWCFLYLVQERHFTVLEGGILAAGPPLCASLGAGVGGVLGTLLVKHYGVRIGLRAIPLVSLPAAGLLLLCAVSAANAYLAAALLALCFFAVELNEGPYWTAIMHVGGADTMSAGGVLNTGGNGGGLVAIPIIAYLSGHQHWTAAFLIGAAFAFAAGLLWLITEPTRGQGPAG